VGNLHVNEKGVGGRGEHEVGFEAGITNELARLDASCKTCDAGEVGEGVENDVVSGDTTEGACLFAAVEVEVLKGWRWRFCRRHRSEEERQRGVERASV
jgi:hypothetical protein